MVIAHFLAAHWSDIASGLGLFFLATAPILPPRLAGMQSEYFDNAQQKVVPQQRQSLVDAITNLVFYTSLRSALVVIGFRGATSIIMFAVIAVDLVYRHTITTNAVIIAIVGIVALYFERLIDEAEELSLWHIFRFTRRQ